MDELLRRLQAPLAVAAVVLVFLLAVVLLILAFKLTKVLLKALLILMSLALLAGLLWWARLTSRAGALHPQTQPRATLSHPVAR